MDFAMSRVEQNILAAVPAYETYFLQLMGKPFLLKPPLFRMNRELLRVTFDSVEQPNGAAQSPERLVMYVEYNRAMKSATVRTEYWQDPKGENPTARGAPRAEISLENLMAPAFAFGWLHLLIADSFGGVLGPVESVSDARMEHAERAIVAADAILAKLGFVIEATDYNEYADALDSSIPLFEADEQAESALRKVGSLVRKAAGAFGATRGGYKGLKARWSAFKSSVKSAYDDGHKKGYDKFRGSKDDDSKASGSKASKTKGGKPKLKLVKGGKKSKSGRKMSDKEYRARYGRARIASSLDAPSSNLSETLSQLQDAFFSEQFDNLDDEGVELIEQMLSLNEAGEKFKIVMGRLKGKGVMDPPALAKWVEQNLAADDDAVEESDDDEPLGHSEGAAREALAVFNRLAGHKQLTRNWRLASEE